jgi:membrane peptidoglycan carboxypeptidase
MTVAMATIANGGKLIMPRIVKSVTAADGKTISSLSPIVLRQVISPEIAREMVMRSRSRERCGNRRCRGLRVYHCWKNRNRTEG